MCKVLMYGLCVCFDIVFCWLFIEVLMGVFKLMLVCGGELLFNCDGVVGWVYNGFVWFVVKWFVD